MARSRIIKPGLFQNEHLAELGPEAMLVFAGLATLADRDGWLEDRPKRIKVQLAPYFNIDMDAVLQSLADSPERFIERKEHEGTRYIRIRQFGLHQSPHHTESTSVISPLFNGCLTSEQPAAHNKYKVTSNKEEVTSSKQQEPPKSPAKFTPPQVPDVAAYCVERKNTVDAQSFCDFYTSKGWKVGNQPMRDWKAAVRTWEKNARGSPNGTHDPRGNLALREKLLAEFDE